MFVVFALIATLPLMALSYLALSETRTALTEEVGRAHSDTARAAAAYVGGYLETGRLIVAADARGLDVLLAARDSDQAAAEASLQALLLRGTSGGSPLFREVALIDPSGRVLASWPPGYAGENWTTRETFLAGRGNGGAILLQPRGTPAVVPIVAPVRDGGTLVGVLAADLDVAPLGASLQAFAFGPSEGVLLTDARGTLLTHPDPSAPLADWSQVEPVRLALAGAPGYLEFNEPLHGTRVLAGYAPVPGLGWAVVELVPAAEAFAGLARLTAVLIVLSGILLGAILLASVVLARRIVRPVRALTTAAGAFAAGRLRTRIDPRGDDEIAELSRTFNTMADRIGESLDGLRRSESRYRNLVESANDVILTVEPDGEVSFAGPQAERVLGWEPGELNGRPIADVVHESDLSRFDAALHDVLSGGAPVLQLFHLVHEKGGATRAFRSNLSPIFGAEGRVARALVVAGDVTAEKRQERVRERSFRMAKLVSEETDLERLAREGLAITLSAAAAVRGAVHIQSGDTLREAATTGSLDAGALAKRAVAELTTVRQGDVIAVPLLERGEALGAIVVDRPEEADVVETLAPQLAVGIRRSLFEARLRGYASELEARVEERTAELQAKNEEIESFLYSVSHDLKAPLISIEGYAEGLAEDYASVLDAEGKAYLERIRKNATLMEKLILDLLELSRIGRVKDETRDVDTRQVVEEIAARVEDRFHAQGGEMVIDPALPRVRGERNRIEQLFGNLIENALKYRHPERPPRVSIRSEPSDEGALIVVEDNGRGVPDEQRDQLFRIFQRLPAPSGMPDPGGTGMGLAIVKRIVETHGGRVWATSQEGRGTRFHVLLPRAEDT